VVSVLETACQARLLVDDAAGYRFAHDLIREVVESDLGLSRRTLLHLDIAASLEDEPGPRPLSFWPTTMPVLTRMGRPRAGWSKRVTRRRRPMPWAAP